MALLPLRSGGMLACLAFARPTIVLVRFLTGSSSQTKPLPGRSNDTRELGMNAIQLIRTSFDVHAQISKVDPYFVTELLQGTLVLGEPS